MWRIHAPEWAEKRGSRLGCSIAAIVEQANEGREAENVREQHALVVGVIGDLADAVEKIDPGFELLFGQLHFACERMQMPNQSGHHLKEARASHTAHRSHHTA